MYNLGLYWAMYPPAMQEFKSVVLPRIIQGVNFQSDLRPEYINGVMAGSADEAQRSGLPIKKLGSVAIISVKGPMVKNSYWSFLASSQAGAAAVKSARMDDDVTDVVLLMDSPGGSVDGLAEFGDEVALLAKEKNVIAQVEGMSASANYYVASQANKIYSGRNDLIGSIGTRILLMDSSKYYEEMGIKMIPVDTGEFKSAGAPGTVITEAHIKDFQRIVDAYFNDFIEIGSSGRGMTTAKFKKAADGRVFLPDEAMDLGLIDGVQTLEETLAQINPKPTSRRKTSAYKGKLQLMNM